MKIIDISRELIGAVPYPGDPAPLLEPVQRISLGDGCNVTALYSCLHQATHADGPVHYFDGEPGIADLPLEPFIGKCQVRSAQGLITGADVERHVPPGCKRLLLRGLESAYLTTSAAFVLAEQGVQLVGTDANSIGQAEEEESVHKELIHSNIMILEGLSLAHVKDGEYFLFAPPVKIAGADGAPVRAVLIKDMFVFSTQ